MSQEYLTTDELALRIKCDARTIRERLKEYVLLEGMHYVRPFGGEKIPVAPERTHMTPPKNHRLASD